MNRKLSFRRNVLTVLCLAGAFASTASGVTIFNCGADSSCSSATTIFQDNFESGTTPSTPSVGSWSAFNTGSSVTNAANPGPAEGSLYAQLTRTGTADSRLFGNMAIDPNPGDIVLLRMMVYIPSASDIANRVDFRLDDSFNRIFVNVRTDGSGHVTNVGSGFTVSPTTLAYTADTWQEWDLQYVMGASTFSVSVDGTTLSGLPVFSAAPAGSLNIDLQNLPLDGLPYFVDAVPAQAGPVPEPGSVWLLGAGIAIFGIGRRAAA